MTRYYFKTTLVGSGPNPQSAWEDAASALAELPGDVTEVTDGWTTEPEDENDVPHYCLRHVETENEWYVSARAVAINLHQALEDAGFITQIADVSNLSWRDDEFYTADGEEWSFASPEAKLQLMQELEDLNDANDPITE